MNLNDLCFANQRGKKKAFKVVNLQLPTVLENRKRKASTITVPTTSSSVRWAYNSRHDSITTTSNATSATLDDCGVIVAITEGRGEATCEIGICAMNTQHPELTLFQISDTNSYMKILNKVHLLNPSEILVPITFSNSRLVDTLKNTFSNTRVIAVDRSVFRKDSGLQFVKDVCSLTYNSVYIILQHKYYALTAAGALRMYLETYKRLTYAKETLKVSYSESDYNTMIDVFAADKLELVACALGKTGNSPNRKHSSLRGILNHCVTKLGSRMLRSNILQPPNQQGEIEKRLDCVEELYKSPERLLGIKDILRKLSNFGQVLSLATLLKSAQQCDERHMNYILQLNEFFDELEPLKELMATSNAHFFHQVRELLCCNEFATLHNLFKGTIHEEARPAYGEQARMARCFAIKSGQSEILDVLRNKYSGHLEEMKKHVSEVAEVSGYDLKLGNNVRKGYHIVLQLAPRYRHRFKISSLPPYFCQIEEMATMVTMKTIKLLSLTNRLDDTCTEILIVSNVLVYNLLLEVQKNIWRFYEMCEHLATLDVLQSLAQATTLGHKYVRPKFDTFTKVVDGRHPLLDYILDNESVPNDINVNPENRLHLITGPNGSGKSIYIRQIVLLQIMAQVGCFVPATTATFKLCDRILARIFLEDNMECGASAFILEMKEIKYFFNVITDKTLIIIDELCRSTALREGTALAMAICEHLLKTPAFIYFTTHYTYIARLQQLYPNIRCWQLETKEIYQVDSKPRLEFTYKVIPGVVTLEAYGLALARTIWPDVITNDVEKLLEKLDDPSMNTSVDKRVALKINLENELAEMKRNGVCFKYSVYMKCLEYQAALRSFGIDIKFEEDDDTSDENPENNITSEHDADNAFSNLSNEVASCGNNNECVEKLLDEATYSDLDESFKILNTSLAQDSSKNVMDIYKSKTNSSMYTEVSYLDQRKRPFIDLNEHVDDNPNQSCPSVVNTTLYSNQKNIDKKLYAQKKQKSLDTFHSLNYFDTNQPSGYFANENMETNKNAINNIDYIPTFLPDLNKTNKCNRSLGNSNTQPIEREIATTNLSNQEKEPKISIFPVQEEDISFDISGKPENSRRITSDSNENFFDFNKSNNLYFNIDTETRQNDNNNQALGLPHQNDNIVEFFGGQNTYFDNEFSYNLALTKQTSFSESLTSGTFMVGLERENASTPLPSASPKIIIDKKKSCLNKKPGISNWRIFEDDINDAIDIIEEESLSQNFNTGQNEEFLDLSNSNPFATHLNKNILNLENSTRTTKTTTENSKPTTKITEILQTNPCRDSSLQEITVYGQTNSSTSAEIAHKTGINMKDNLRLLPSLMENSHITDEDTSATRSTEIENYNRQKKFEAPIKKCISKWTKKEIQESFNKQRINMLQSKNSADVEAYCKEMDNRPTVKQIQSSEVIATARKTPNGQYVVDIPKQTGYSNNFKTAKDLKKAKPRFKPPLKEFERNIKFDSAILSDVNSRAFDKLIENNKTQSGHGSAQSVKNVQSGWSNTSSYF